MKSLLSFKTSASALLVVLGAIVLFHILVLVGIIPYEIVWGGKLQSHDQMLVMELVSISLNGAMIFFVLLRAGWLSFRIRPVIPSIAMWVMVVLFAFNTLGNLLSENEFEKMVFTPMTVLLCLLSLRLTFKEQLPAKNLKINKR